ncbi:NF-kappa-B inhibitor-interacting Ras-like protein isoform X2 [Metopolophium dirhodum]|uniref:NF-kappa-B inhibitor-interacting Ras-like protein isoform X2 n=1 Tax=Metopolophium dirhodum TaxID=44670 RepID=UPI00298FDA9B|nr:NF-kappa-B inhibitor-interacting Ras-like protein isoform X2 [Metopolophium dirhodum]
MVKNYRVVVFGVKGVGKTAILEQAIYGHFSKNYKLWPTIEDIYQASIDIGKGVREQVRFYDTAGLDLTQLPEVGLYSNPDPSLMLSFGQIAKQYASIADAFILVYDTSRPETFDCLVTLKKEIDKNKEKKDAFYVIVGHRMREMDIKAPTLECPTSRASHWSIREKMKHFEVNALDRTSLFEPFIYIASKFNTVQPKSSFPQLVRKVR